MAANSRLAYRRRLAVYREMTCHYGHVNLCVTYLLTYLLTYLQWPAAFVKPPLVKAGPLRDGDVLLSVCLFVCLSVCRLRNLWSHSLRGSTLRQAEVYHVDSDTLICDSIALISKSIIMINVKKLQFIHKLTASGTSKTAKITKRWLPISTSPKCQCAAE